MISIPALHKTYFQVSIDGTRIGATPYLKKPITSGRHTIEFFHSKTGQLLEKKSVVVAPGELVTVMPPAP